MKHCLYLFSPKNVCACFKITLNFYLTITEYFDFGSFSETQINLFPSDELVIDKLTEPLDIPKALDCSLQTAAFSDGIGKS